MELKAVIKFDSDFLTGNGLGKIGIADNLATKDKDGIPYINGREIKGIIRNSCEHIAYILDLDICDGVFSQNKKLCGVNYREKQKCCICRIFGSSQTPSSFHFSSASSYDTDLIQSLQKDHTELGILTRIQFHNSLENKIAKKNFLFSDELASKTCELKFKIKQVEECDDIDALTALLIMACYGVKGIGSKKTRGYGKCSIKIEKLFTNEFLDENFKLDMKKLDDLKGKLK